MRRTILPFLTVGAICAGIQYFILVAAVEFIHWPPLVASTIGFCLSAMINYWLNYHFTFSSRASHATAAGRFVLVATVGLLINSGTMLALETFLGLYYLLAQVLATCLTVAWNLSASHHWTFRAPADGGHR